METDRHVDRQCPICGITYTADLNRLEFGRQTTCSRDCSYTLRRNKMQNRVPLVCSVCGAEFCRSPSQVKSKHEGVYCSRSCHYRGRTLGTTPRVVTSPYVIAPVDPRIRSERAKRAAQTRKDRGNNRHSDDTRRKLSEATTLAIAEGRVPRVSKLEDEVAQMLDRLGVGFTRQHPIRGDRGRFVACVDFALDDGSVLEVNGTFWHADPRSFPDGPIYPSQVRSAEAWSRKVDLLESLDIELKVLWEADFRDDPSEATRRAVA